MKASIEFIVCAKVVDDDCVRHVHNVLQLIAASGADHAVTIVYHEANVSNVLGKPSENEAQVKLLQDDGRGIYSAMNLGVRATNREFVYFCNPGDSLLCVPNDLIGDINCFPVAVIGSDGEYRYLRTPDHNGRLMPPHQGMFARRNLLTKVPFDEQLQSCGDLDWYLKTRHHAVFYKFPVVSYFRLGGISNNPKYFFTRKIERLRILKAAYKRERKKFLQYYFKILLAARILR